MNPNFKQLCGLRRNWDLVCICLLALEAEAAKTKKPLEIWRYIGYRDEASCTSTISAATPYLEKGGFGSSVVLG